jgi:hypothetical protein
VEYLREMLAQQRDQKKMGRAHVPTPDVGS